MAEPHLSADNDHDGSTNRDQAPATQPEGPQADDTRSAPPPKQDPLIGLCLANDYLILDRLGAGGMAIVYKAKQLKTDRIVALKTLRERDANIMERFYREVQTLSKLKHNNIVEALDCIRTDATHTFLVMEYVEGDTLETLLRTKGRVESASDIAVILSQVCDALEHAHQQRIIHRDLKPANIVIMSDEWSGITAKVLDFGIAKLQDDMQKLTSEGQALGSPLYMSPEQCMGLEITPASDVYSMGILSYQLITGELPYRSSKMLEIMSAHCSPDVWPQPIFEIRPDLPGVNQLNQIIFKALSTKLEERYQTIGEFGKAISSWIRLTRNVETSAAIKAQMPKAIPSNRKDTAAVGERTARKSDKLSSASSKKVAEKRLTPDQVALLKVASFLVIAITLSSVLSIIVMRNMDSIKTGFMGASRSVSNILTPAPPKAVGGASLDTSSQDTSGAQPQEAPEAIPNTTPEGMPGEKPKALPRPGYGYDEEQNEPSGHRIKL